MPLSYQPRHHLYSPYLERRWQPGVERSIAQQHNQQQTTDDQDRPSGAISSHDLSTLCSQLLLYVLALRIQSMFYRFALIMP
jgi:hypothetical protein